MYERLVNEVKTLKKILSSPLSLLLNSHGSYSFKKKMFYVEHCGNKKSFSFLTQHGLQLYYAIVYNTHSAGLLFRFPFCHTSFFFIAINANCIYIHRESFINFI